MFGESFRLGGQGNRNIGSYESYDGQIKASTSHASFIKDLKSKNVDVNVYISSYNTQFKNDLINLFADVLIGYDFYEGVIGQGNLIYNALNKICSLTNIYDFIFIMRIDIFLKTKFTEIFNPSWNKIMWHSVCLKPYHKSGIHPRVNDMMIFIPKKYYRYLNCLYYNPDGHDQWEYLINNTDLTYDDLDTIINTLHDPNTSTDFNPLYYVVNRPESQIHISHDEIFDKFSFQNNDNDIHLKMT